MDEPWLERRGGLLLLRLGEGENRLDGPRLAALEGALDVVERESDVTGLVTVGSGRFYSNGYDLDWLAARDRAERRRFIQRTQALWGRWLTLPVPSAAAVTGHAFGAGLLLAMAHDHRVMRQDRGFLCLPEVDVGIPLRPGMWALLEGRVGYRALRDASLTGARLAGPQAQAGGWVDALAPGGEELGRAEAWLRGQRARARRGRAALAARLHARATGLLSRPS